MEGPVSWSVTLWDENSDHTLHHLPQGLTLAEAKAKVIALIEATKAV